MSIKPQYQATPDTLTDRQYSGLRVDETGALVTTGPAADGSVTVSAIGAPSDAAWNETDPEATVIALLKALVLKTGV